MLNISKHVILTFITMMLLLSIAQPKLAFGKEIKSKQYILASGNVHLLAIKENGTVWSWGGNTYGQLGDETKANKSSPVQVKGLTDIISVKGGQSFSLALKSDGTVWAWGSNKNGQLGIDTINDSIIPMKIESLTDIVAISNGLGDDHSFALKADGTVWAWGLNHRGQIGDGTAIDKKTPVKIDIDNIVEIVSSYSHTLALKSDGTVWAWGQNTKGQLGDGTTADKRTPIQVQGLTDIISINVGADHSLALKSDGTVWAWGGNSYRQLGNGSTANSLVPLQIDGLTDITQIAGGRYHSLALKSDGTILSWGWNTSGQLGDGTKIDKSTPVKVLEITDVVSITAGSNHSVALKSDGTIWSWGSNTSGQLGDGTTADKILPVQVNDLVLEPQNPNPEVPGTDNPSPENPSDSSDSQSDDIDFLLDSGTLELQTSPIKSFGKIKISNQIKSYKTSFDTVFNIKDLRGTQEGWRLDVSATQFKVVEPSGGFKAGTSAHILPVGTLTLSPLESISRVGTGNGNLPVNRLNSNTVIDDGIVTVASANKGDGAGEFNLKFPENALTLIINPATAKVDKINYPNGTPYEATVTWTLVSAP